MIYDIKGLKTLNVSYSKNQSNADFALELKGLKIDHSAEYFGFGAWRIKQITKTSLALKRVRVIKIDRIADPLNVYFDKNAEQPDYSDANHVTILVKMTKTSLGALLKAEVSNFDYYDKEWFADDCVIVAEHWYKQMSLKRFICCKILKMAAPRQVLKKSHLHCCW